MAENLKPMQSFLIDVRKLKEHKGTETVKDSLATLRETIYAADDILLDCRIRTGGILSPLFRYQTGKRLNEINMQINQIEKNLRTYLPPMMSQKNNRDECNHNTRWTTHLYDQADIILQTCIYVKLVDNGYEDSVITSLQLSYDELPADLKHCMLCFSIYPEDSEISAEQLVHWWVGESFVSGTNERTATQVAFDYISELFRRCLIEVVNHMGYDGKIFECKMHAMVRNLIIKMAKEEAFCSFGDGNVQQFDAESRHLGLTSEIKTQSLLHQSNSKLRALIWLTNNNPFSVFFSSPSSTSIGLANVNSLRVLDLSQSKLDYFFSIDDLLRWIKSQRRLAYLNLSGVSSLKEVPDWIGKLQNLQILILTGCHNLEKLSSNVTTLQNLTVLDIGNCSSLQNLPHGLGKLSNLQELSGFKLAASQGATEGCRLGDLMSLTNLRVLRINMREDDDIKDEELAVLSDLHHLKVLSVDTKGCENEAIIKQLDQLSPPQCLEELYLSYYHGHIIPSWITPYNLPQLQYLCIENGPPLTGMRPRFWVSKHKYWKLKGLCLKYLPTLVVHWVTVQEIMSSIEYVEVSKCYMLRNFPFNDKYFCWRKKNEEEI